MSLLLLGVGGVTWTPLQFSDTIWFLDGNSRTWQDAGTTPATQSADVVGQWDDLTGNGWHMSNAVGSTKMRLQVGYSGAYNAVYGDSVDDTLANAYTEAATEVWYWIVGIRQEGSPGVGQNIMATTQRLIFEQGNNNRYEQFGGSTLSAGFGPPASRTIKLVKTVWAGGSSFVSEHNGTSWTNGTVGNAGSGAGANQTIGVGGGQPKGGCYYIAGFAVPTQRTAPQEDLIITWAKLRGLA